MCVKIKKPPQKKRKNTKTNGNIQKGKRKTFWQHNKPYGSSAPSFGVRCWMQDVKKVAQAHVISSPMQLAPTYVGEEKSSTYKTICSFLVQTKCKSFTSRTARRKQSSSDLAGPTGAGQLMRKVFFNFVCQLLPSIRPNALCCATFV